MNKVEIIENESGDWTVIKLNGEVFSSGHDRVSWGMLGLLRELGVELVETEITDDEMEELY